MSNHACHDIGCFDDTPHDCHVPCATTVSMDTIARLTKERDELAAHLNLAKETLDALWGVGQEVRDVIVQRYGPTHPLAAIRALQGKAAKKGDG